MKLKGNLELPVLSRLGKPYQIVRVIVFCFYVNRDFSYLPEAIRPYLEAFLFSWDSFYFWFSRITFEYYCRFDTDVYAFV
jgi:hypothetical protein